MIFEFWPEDWSNNNFLQMMFLHMNISTKIMPPGNYDTLVFLELEFHKFMKKRINALSVFSL